MSANWQTLRKGDRIRFLRMPPSLLSPNEHVPPETLSLYELLIATGDPIEIDDFLENGAPIAGYIDRSEVGSPVFHGLVIDDSDEGCWERVAAEQ